ncbi:MAG: hypothetical protein ABI199_04660 [Bacteroidia bacterium]
MKKTFLAIVAIAFIVLTMMSCRSQQHCAAYGGQGSTQHPSHNSI